LLSKKALSLNFLLLAGLCGAAAGQGIYTCIDAKGRKITADRPIAECTDRTQQELTSTGSVRRQIGPTQTAQERGAQEEKDKLAAEVRAREAEDKRRDRALLLRYPSPAVHQQERSTALAQIDEVIKASSKRTLELAEQRKAMNGEFEFYVKDPAKAPLSLKRRLEENDASVAVQKRFVLDQDQEKKRVNMRFDEELVKLKSLWQLAGVVPANAAAWNAGGLKNTKAGAKP
jgi:hypothetical protein